MCLTGFFLIAFLLVHLTLNSFIIFDDSGDLFNQGAHFMGTNPIVKIVEPVLAIGFILHIVYAVYLTMKNQRTRPQNYSTQKMGKSSSWASRNMFVLGSLILIFLVIHIINFYWKIRFIGDPLLAEVEVNGKHMEDAFRLVTTLFLTWKWSVLIYVLGAGVLGLHLYHAFWSAFQTLGWSNLKWRNILKIVGLLYSLLIACGFAIIPLWVLIKSII
jgi:succinate dehydrogenase / fumarate reductase cytochrome b subunit